MSSFCIPFTEHKIKRGSPKIRMKTLVTTLGQKQAVNWITFEVFAKTHTL